ncbi:ATP-binding cassette domain-containing protein [Geodermatophilus nigrescens]|uniref:ABC-2 type transport system ATP-binding protein n=1 Tax=Geodermatophilus nigrescens TaxID=1070870 RepID=A0A1M5R3K6_9ACTN|nr:ATP-binding cassette domain-containing protein [Geodermatophilus nigrescens]SHH20600.1 ABC-2 type transport system ATP-binding protein [Geodermatophilus nigrescens]
MTVVPTVALTGVTKRFRGTAALDDVHLTLGPGITGLLGPNGAGKTTLLRITATVLTPGAGEVVLFGTRPAGPEQLAAVRRRLGYLPQEMGHPRGFTGFGFVDYMAVLKEWTDRAARHAEVRRVLELVDLDGVAARRVSALSGGQRRRLGLAQALLGDPDLLLLDEPTTGVDPGQRVTLRQVLSRAGERSTVLLSTHQTEDVAALCDRVVVLDGGRVRFDGAVADLVATAAGRVWLADAPDPAARASWRTGTGRHRVVGQAAPAGAEPAEPTLEDAYLLLLGERARTTGVAA